MSDKIIFIMKIYLIRHGESTGDMDGRYGGDYDDHLSEKGLQQAKELAKKLIAKQIEIVFSSPRLRARETANEIANELNVGLEIIENLRERNNYGVLSGLTEEEASIKFLDELAKIKIDKTHHDVLESESYDDNVNRGKRVFDELFMRDYKIIAIVSHGGIIGNYFREVLTNGKNLKLGDCGVVEIDKKGDDIKFKCLYNSELN